MEFSNVLELIKTVSESNLTSFKFEQGDTKIVMSTASQPTVTTTESVVMQNQEINLGVTSTNVPNLAAGKNIIKSPLVGTFYAAPSEDAQPFVQKGDSVKKGQVLAIVEAMKLMNDIESEFDGKIVEIYVSNGESVEYGQPLFAIE